VFEVSNHHSAFVISVEFQLQVWTTLYHFLLAFLLAFKLWYEIVAKLTFHSNLACPVALNTMDSTHFSFLPSKEHKTIRLIIELRYVILGSN
jgi:hypothetical protein